MVKNWEAWCSAVHGVAKSQTWLSDWTSLYYLLIKIAFPFSRGIFPTQGLNPGLQHCGRILYQLSHKGSPRRVEWVAYPFSRGSSRARNQTTISYTAGRFFTNWATREASTLKVTCVVFLRSLCRSYLWSPGIQQYTTNTCWLWTQVTFMFVHDTQDNHTCHC